MINNTLFYYRRGAVVFHAPPYSTSLTVAGHCTTIYYGVIGLCMVYHKSYSLGIVSRP